MIKGLTTLGRYLSLMGQVFSKPERIKVYFKEFIREIATLGVDSIGIVVLISLFIGAVITIQIKLNIESPWMPRWTVGYVTREILVLEFSSSIMCLILAGKVGSNIASEIGTMRVTQQIDALEIMGVNSACYLILPKVLALMVFIPLLVTFGIIAGILGAYATCWFGGIMNATDLEAGLQYEFKEWYIWCSFIKSIFFAFIIASVSAYFGYTVKGGSNEVGKASTDSVVCCSVLILFADLVLTNLL
jgi:phospholipid/cholesterol/gamma-HCH transport system permease protein